MSVAAKIGKKAILFANGIVNTAVMIIILLLIAIGCYAIWDSDQVFQTANASRYELYKPDIKGESKSFAELQAINPDIFGWITVYGTHIDYPLVQGADNMHYVNTNAEGEYSLSGAIFLDNRCSRDFLDFSSVIYGHHMEKQAMFGEIGNFNDKQYFDARKYGSLYYNGKQHGLEFFAIFHADAYDNTVFRTGITDREDQQAYLEMLLKIATNTRDIQVTADDKIVLLSTCSASSTNGRDILLGRITDELYEDTFKTNETENIIKKILMVDKLTSLWPEISVWLQFALIGLLFFVRNRFNKKIKL